MAASICARCSRAWAIRAATCCLSKAIVAPSGSCSSSVPAGPDESTIPRNSRSRPPSWSRVPARSAASSSCAPACPVTLPWYQPAHAGAPCPPAPAAGGGCSSGPAVQLADRPVQLATSSSLAQYLHLVAATGISADRQLGHVLVGGGSPKTDLPRRFM